MNQPLLHVMIPAYGESPYLRQTLESAVKYLLSFTFFLQSLFGFYLILKSNIDLNLIKTLTLRT
jgi:hypothetical protein